jgi:EAL domain-containing protein (putative c-di-GMP-specific phosphodiesterase class I)
MRFLFFLDKKRKRNLPVSVADLRAARNRFVTTLVVGLGRAGFPYMKSPPRMHLGYGVGVHNPLVSTRRVLARALRDADEVAALDRRSDELQTLEKLQDLLVRERIVTAYQAIVRMPDRSAMAYEALSRGAKGSGLETAGALFGAAETHGYMVELDRMCRSRALLSSSRVPPTARIFVNTLPTTIRDPLFRGKPLIDFLHKANVAPNRIVIEITEKLVIENYNLFQETMAYFTDLGMNFAVDDVGAGYSGLEAIARLKPAFLKIDMALVRDVHVSNGQPRDVQGDHLARSRHRRGGDRGGHPDRGGVRGAPGDGRRLRPGLPAGAARGRPRAAGLVDHGDASISIRNPSRPATAPRRACSPARDLADERAADGAQRVEHRGAVVHDVGVQLHHVVEVGAGGLQRDAQVLEDALGLCLQVALADQLALFVERDLARDEDRLAAAHRHHVGVAARLRQPTRVRALLHDAALARALGGGAGPAPASAASAPTATRRLTRRPPCRGTRSTPARSGSGRRLSARARRPPRR